MSFLIRSGNATSGTIGNAAVLSGSIGSGQIASGHFASGFVAGILSGSANLTSGQVGSGFLGNNSVLSGNIGSGQVSTPHFASGTAISYANAIMAPFIAEDMISGVRAVTININPGGDAVVRIAQPLSQGISNGAHWPAQGIVIDDVVSGGTVNVYFQGLVYSDRWSGNWSTNFTFNNPAWVNGSGGIDTIDTISVFSGSHMPIGTWINASGLYLNAIGGLVASGSVNRGAYQSDSIQSYAIGSGQVQQFQLGDQAVLSGNLRSGLITTGAQELIDELVTFAGETISGGGAGVLLAVTADNSLSGRTTVLIANPADSTRRPAFGVVTKNYASGDPVQVITHGVIPWPNSVNTNLGQPFFVGTSGQINGLTFPSFSGSIIQPMGWALGRGLGGNQSGSILIQPMIPMSGTITYGLIASGAIFGFGQSGLSTAARNIASGSIGGFDIANKSINSGQMGDQFINHVFITSGGVLSGNIAAGNIGRGHLASGTRGYGTEFDFVAGELISGVKAVALSTDVSINGFIVRAERQSGGRLPVIGVTISGAASGQSCTVVTQGFVPDYASGMMASGATGRIMYVGSGGLIVNTSGFGAGASSGAHLLSGSVAQKVGVYAVFGSGLIRGIMVNPSPEITSGVLTTAQGNF